MTDTKKLPASRIDIALQYLKASETNDKAAYERLLSDTYHSTTWPTENPDDVTSTKEKVLVAYAWYDKYREIQAIPIDVMETTDGRIILHSRYKGLRNDGKWMQFELITFLSFTEGTGPLDDPQICHSKMFYDWVGMMQFSGPSHIGQVPLEKIYNHFTGLKHT